MIKYSKVPIETVSPTLKTIPEKSGIYFVWGDTRQIVYIGKSKNLRHRVTTSYPRIGSSRVVSFLFYDLSELDYAECFYIGVYQPHENFKDLLPIAKFKRQIMSQTNQRRHDALMREEHDVLIRKACLPVVIEC